MAQESWRLGKDETGCQPPEGPVLCAKNCGFFGSKSTMNMCSKCYRDHVLDHAREIPERPESQRALKLGEPSVPFLPKETSEATSICTSGSSSEDANVSASVAGSQEQQKSLPSRCFSCRKRVGLTGFKCRCGNVFCSLHRYSDKHDCSVDYKTLGRDAIAKANPVVAANKIDKI